VWTYRPEELHGTRRVSVPGLWLCAARRPERCPASRCQRGMLLWRGLCHRAL